MAQLGDVALLGIIDRRDTKRRGMKLWFGVFGVVAIVSMVSASVSAQWLCTEKPMLHARATGR
jgi:hypothetical protein